MVPRLRGQALSGQDDYTGMPPRKTQPDSNRLDRVVADARRNQDQREKTYREQALKLYPWVCGRCTREFTHTNLHLLTVHHRDHDHDNTPTDGSNWELLCLDCHDNEHRRLLDAVAGAMNAAGGHFNSAGVTGRLAFTASSVTMVRK